jgi:ATP-dependent DNA helicase RecG
MKQDEKDAIMASFKAGDVQVLVSTTVIEVGIDVPNASVMLIEHAERFGLSQLHQLRGRVGRGAAQSFCYLVAHPPISEEGRRRLNTMVSTNDGFVIAETDLEIRGPGEFFGTIQSGMPGFKHAHLVRDQELLKAARHWAEQIIEADFALESEQYSRLHDTYFPMYHNREKLFNL